MPIYLTFELRSCFNPSLHTFTNRSVVMVPGCLIAIQNVSKGTVQCGLQSLGIGPARQADKPCEQNVTNLKGCRKIDNAGLC